MKHAAWVALAATLALASVNGRAQTATPTYSLTCESTGTAPREPLGDRDGHTLSASAYTCRVVGGPLDGGVTTGAQNWEWQGPNGTGLGGSGVMRHSKGTLVYALLADSKNNVKMDNGKVVGYAGSGTGRYTLATGAAATYVNKTFSYVFRSTGFNQFAVDVTVE